MAETFELDIWVSWGIIGLKLAIQNKSFTIRNLNVYLRIMIIDIYYRNLNKFWLGNSVEPQECSQLGLKIRSSIN